MRTESTAQFQGSELPIVFIEAIREPLEQASISIRQYLDIAKVAVAAKNSLPEAREDIAYFMVSIGSKSEDAWDDKVNPLLYEIVNYFAHLELPDGQIARQLYSNAMPWPEFEQQARAYVDKQWQELAEKIEQADQQYSG